MKEEITAIHSPSLSSDVGSEDQSSLPWKPRCEGNLVNTSVNVFCTRINTTSLPPLWRLSFDVYTFPDGYKDMTWLGILFVD